MSSITGGRPRRQTEVQWMCYVTVTCHQFFQTKLAEYSIVLILYKLLTVMSLVEGRKAAKLKKRSINYRERKIRVC